MNCCSHEGCDRPAGRRGLCGRHYEAQRVAKYRRRPLSIEDAWQDAVQSVRADRELKQRSEAAMRRAGGAL